MTTRQVNTPEWIIVSFKKPTLWSRSENETWMFQPNRRYILNASQFESIKEHVDTVSDLKSGRFYNPLRATKNLANTKILVERHRDRGFGDYLFLTGPLNYLKHISGGSASIHLYALCDRGSLLDYHPSLAFETPLSGPIQYDDLHLYNYQWFIESVTEYTEEKDQPNVYDQLYRQLDLDPSSISPTYKRPTMHLVDQDYKDLDSMYYYLFIQRKIDLRKTPYYVVSPSANATVRSMSYRKWLQIIGELAKIRPVVVIGAPSSVRSPSTDMTYGTFIHHLDKMGGNVINVIGETPVRVIAALIQKAVAMFSLDSGMLYVAQAFRVPAISIWGPYSPWVRIGYDSDYMELAIWNRETCSHSPCFTYEGFPHHKCPRGNTTTICEPLLSVTAEQVLDKLNIVEKKLSSSATSK